MFGPSAANTCLPPTMASAYFSAHSAGSYSPFRVTAYAACAHISPRYCVSFFSMYPSHILSMGLGHKDFVLQRKLIHPSPAQWDSCSSGRKFAYSFLQIPPRGGHPCCSANNYCSHSLFGTFTLKVMYMPGAPCRTGGGRCLG